MLFVGYGQTRPLTVEVTRLSPEDKLYDLTVLRLECKYPQPQKSELEHS